MIESYQMCGGMRNIVFSYRYAIIGMLTGEKTIDSFEMGANAGHCAGYTYGK